MIKFRKAVEALKKSRNIKTNQAAAEAMGISPFQLEHWQKGQHIPDFRNPAERQRLSAFISTFSAFDIEPCEMFDQIELLPLAAAWPGPVCESPEDEIINRIDRQRMLAKALADAGLTTRQKLTLGLIAAGLTQEEIASRLGVTKQGASAKIHRSLKILRRRAAAGLFEPEKSVEIR